MTEQIATAIVYSELTKQFPLLPLKEVAEAALHAVDVLSQRFYLIEKSET